MRYKINQVFVDNKVKNSPIVEEFIKKTRPEKLAFGDGERLKETLGRFSLEDGKRSVFLARSKGKYLKACPGMEEPYLCCNLRVLNIISNCPIHCSYCFLQFYLNSPVTTVYTDFPKVREELKTASWAHPELFFRVTTGELSDSLALDRETNFSPKLIRLFREIPNGLLELKSKTPFVDHLLSLDHGERTVLSWSLNSKTIIDEEERGAASLRKRIEAARKAEIAGYLLGFHFDPLIHYSGWERDYEQTIKFLFQKISASRVAWISLGSLRFTPGMEEKIAKTYPKSKLPYGEMVIASDGKKRYIKPLRFRLYEMMLDWIREYGGNEVFIYLCMETPRAWEKAMGFQPRSPGHLDFLFAESLYHRFESLFPRKPLLKDYLKGWNTRD